MVPTYQWNAMQSGCRILVTINVERRQWAVWLRSFIVMFVEVWRGVVWWEGGWEWGMLSMFQKCEWMGESEWVPRLLQFWDNKKIRVI